MNKNRMILAVSGGVILVATLVMAFFNWSAYSSKVAALEGDDEEGTQGLETMRDQASSLSRKEIYPCAESEKAIAENAERVADWCVEARKLASRGDAPVQVTTPPQFKADIAADAKRLVALPGAVGGALAKPDFAFGPFRPFIAEGKMPTEAEIPGLMRQWGDVEHIVEILSTNGVAELVDVAFKADAAAADAEKEMTAKEKKAAKKSRRAAKKAVEPSAVQPSAFNYVITFKTRPAGFVSVLNALGKDERFIVVNAFSITRAGDPIGAALGAGDKKAAQSQLQGGGRRARHLANAKKQAAAEAEESEPTSKIVTDPALDAPFTVALDVTVYDFRTMEKSADPADAEGSDDEGK